MVDFKYMLTDEYKQKQKEREEQERIKEELRMKTACFTGHRPSKLGGYDMKNPTMLKLKEKLLETIEIAITREGIEHFISGGALGTDTAGFYCVHMIKEKHPHIKNILAIPFKDQANAWSDNQQYWYNKMVNLADEVVYVDELDDYKMNNMETKIYHPAKMQKRNEYMIDESNLIIAVYDGTKGGTGNCLYYARRNRPGRTLFLINPKYMELEVLYNYGY